MLQLRYTPGLQHFSVMGDAGHVTKRLQKVYRTDTCENRAVVLIYVSERLFLLMYVNVSEKALSRYRIMCTSVRAKKVISITGHS